MDAEPNNKSLRASKHVTRACLGCRQRKTKCDGVRPRCANCRLHSQTCTMPQEIDRRKVPSKDRYARLEQYAQSLEATIAANGLQNPEQMAKPATPRPVASQSTYFPVGQGTADRGLYDTPATRGPGPDPEDDAIDLLSERFGSLQVAEDGHLRFFGATSNLHITHVGPFPLIASNIRSAYGREQEILHNASVSHVVSEELEEHLLRLYFCWENPNIPVVDANIYYSERRTYRRTGRPSHRYSEVLTNAMCAVGAALTSRTCPELPESLADFFAGRAKALLDVAMDSPTLCTVQALVILSGVEALLMRDARGWLYSGMAMRLSTDLGLHLNAGPRRNLHFDMEETRLRKIVFWGAFIHDRMWSFYVGRPESLDQKHILVSIPTADELSGGNQATWKPYADEDQSLGGSELPALLGETAQYTVTLCIRMSEIRRVLYTIPEANDADIKQSYSSARRMKADLLAWAESLSKPLALDLKDTQTQHPPHVLQLHMQYFAILAILHRPFAFGSSWGHSSLAPAETEESRIACTDAATGITTVLQTMRRQYGVSRMNIHTVHLIFTAALIHVRDLYFAPTSSVSDSAQRSLQVCSQALCEIGRAYKNALRALEIIMCIKADVERRRQRHLKRPSIGVESLGPEETLGKRVRVDTRSSPGSAGMEVPPVRSSRSSDFNDFDFLEGEGLDLSSSSVMGGDALFTEPWAWTPRSWPSGLENIEGCFWN